MILAVRGAGEKHYPLLIAVMLALTATLFAGCGLFDKPKDETPSSDSASTGTVSGDFTAANAETLKTSIIGAPESLTITDLSAAAKPGALSAGRARMASASEGMDGVFAAIPLYIGLAELTKTSIAGMMVDMLPLLAESVEGEILTLPPSTDPYMPKRAMVEKSASYDWKVSAFYTDAGTAPEMVLHFSLKSGGIKGRCIWNRSMENYFFANAGFTTEMPVYLDIAFDGASAVKTLEVKFHQDLTLGRAWASGNGVTLQDLLNANLAQPEKVFLTISLNGAEVTVNGISYHPGLATGEALGITVPGWGDKRTMYLFKAKAKADVGAAKLYLALPEEDRTDMTGVWEDSSLSMVVGSVFTGILNAFVDAIYDAAGNTAAAVAVWVITADFNATYKRGNSIARQHLLDFAEKDLSSEGSDFQNLQTDIRSVLYLVNPAFYIMNYGFLGTYNDGTMKTSASSPSYYKYDKTTGRLAKSSDPDFIAAINNLNAYTLDEVIPYVPATVKDVVITVE